MDAEERWLQDGHEGGHLWRHEAEVADKQREGCDNEGKRGKERVWTEWRKGGEEGGDEGYEEHGLVAVGEGDVSLNNPTEEVEGG